MKHHTYKIHFTQSSPVEVQAGSEEDAKILAMAERIEAGLARNVKHVECLDPPRVIRRDGRIIYAYSGVGSI